MQFFRLLSIATLAGLIAGCTTGPQRGDPPMALAPFVDLDRFMGKWYVHGYTPTLIDPAAYNPTETYERAADGRILTTYQFNAGDFDGKQKTYRPVARIFDKESNAEWRMRFFGVINAPYLIIYVSEDYRYTVIGHPDRDLAWIMSRSPEIAEDQYGQLLSELEKRNFDLSTFRRGFHE